MNTLQNPNINKLQDSIKVDSIESNSSIESEVLATQMQSLVYLITEISDLSELDKKIKEEAFPINEHTEPIIQFQLIDKFFDFNKIHDYLKFESSLLNDLIVKNLKLKFKKYDNQSFIDEVIKIDKQILENQSDNPIVASIKEHIVIAILNSNDLSDSFDLVNLFSINILSEDQQSQFISKVLNSFNLVLTGESVNFHRLSEASLRNPELLNDAPDSLLSFILKIMPVDRIPEFIDSLLDCNPANFARVLKLTNNSGIINVYNFKDCFVNYFKINTYNKIINLFNFIEEFNLYNLLDCLMFILPEYGIKQKMKFKLFEKSKLIKKFDKSTVELFENIFYKKAPVSDVNNISKLIKLTKDYFQDKVSKSKTQEIHNELLVSKTYKNVEILDFDIHKLKIQLQNLDDLHELNNLLRNHNLQFEYRKGKFISKSNNNKIEILISDEILNKEFQDSNNLDSKLVSQIENFDFNSLKQDSSISNLDPLSIKFLMLKKLNSDALEAIESYSNKQFLISSGIGLKIITSNGSNSIVKNSRKYFIGNFIGQGSFGTIEYGLANINGKYEITAIKQPVADESVVYGFQSEIEGSKVQQVIQNPNLITIHDTGTTKDQFIVLETGENAKSFLGFLNDPNTSAEETINHFETYFKTLESLWKSGYCHLDFKPGNAIIYNDQFTQETKAKIIDLNLPKISNILSEVWFRSVDFSFSQHFIHYTYLVNECYHNLDFRNQNLQKLFLDQPDSQTWSLIYFLADELNKYKKTESYDSKLFEVFQTEVAKANDLKALVRTLHQCVVKKGIKLDQDSTDTLQIYISAMSEVNQLKKQLNDPNHNIDFNHAMKVFKIEFDLFRDMDLPNRLTDILAKIKLLNSGQEIKAPENKESDSLSQQTIKLPNVEVKVPKIESSEMLELQNTEASKIESHDEKLKESSVESTLILDDQNPKEIDLSTILSDFFQKENPTEEEFSTFMIQVNTLFEQRNGQKQSLKRKLKNFVFGKVSLKTKLKAAAISIPTGAILSSKAILAATGLGTIIGTSPVMPVVLMTIFFKTCSASALSTIFTKGRLKKLLKNDSLDSRVLKLFYYANQAVGTENDIQKELNINLETLKQGGPLSMDEIKTSLEALSKTSSQDKIKDFLGGLGLGMAFSSAIYYGLNLEPVSNFINDQINTVKGWLSGLIESNSSTAPIKPQPSIPNHEPVNSTPDSVDNNPQNQPPIENPLPTSVPESSDTQGYIQPTGSTSDAIQISSNGSRVHMRGPNGENLKNTFGFKRFWSNSNPWVRVDLNNPKVVSINGENQVIYQTLLKGKLSGRWISGAILSR